MSQRRQRLVYQLVDEAAQMQLVSEELAQTPPPCTGVTVVTTAGAVPVEVAELLTDCRSTGVTLDQVKAVLDPLNWDDCSRYFCGIVDLGVRADGWSLILEKVSLSCPSLSRPSTTAPETTPAEDLIRPSSSR